MVNDLSGSGHVSPWFTVDTRWQGFRETFRVPGGETETSEPRTSHLPIPVQRYPHRYR